MRRLLLAFSSVAACIAASSAWAAPKPEVKCYFWADQAKNSNPYSPSDQYSFSKGPITIVRVSKGLYTITCEGVIGKRDERGIVQVTATDGAVGRRFCVSGGWGVSGKDLSANIMCFHASASSDGGFEDSSFNFMFVNVQSDE